MNKVSEKKTAVFGCPECKSNNGFIELVPVRPITLMVDCFDNEKYFVAGSGNAGTLKTKDIETAICKICGHVGDVESFVKGAK